MKVKKAIRKVAALMAGASMVGATIIGASAAADLANYPSPFIKDGVFNAIMVVGDQAKAEDVIGITDIATSLQFAAKVVKQAAGGTTTKTTVEGDSWMIGTRGDQLELSDGSGNYNEDFDSQITRVTDTELKALADGTGKTNKGTAAYEQYLRLDDGNVTFEEDTDTDLVADYVKYVSGDNLVNYSLEFRTSLESDIEDVNGAATGSDIYLGDYEDEELKLLGKTYTILKARKYSATQTGIKLTLLGGDVSDTIEEGETKTYNINGKEYVVHNKIVTDSGTITTQFVINDQITKKMQEDETETMADGTILGVADILANEAGDVTGDLVRFYLGAQKIELHDSNISNTAQDDSKLAINDESVADAIVRVTGSNSSTTYKIDTIQIDLEADDNIWVAAGKKLSENSQLDTDTASALKALGVDIYYAGLTEEPTGEIKLESSSDNRYQLKFKNTDGNDIAVPLAYDNDTATTGGLPTAIWGDNNDRLVVFPQQLGILDDQYFILTDKTNTVSGFTEVVQYKGSSKSTDSNAEAKFKLLSTGETVTRSLGTSSTGNVQITLTVGGTEYTFVNTSSAAVNNFGINITTATGANGPSYTQLVSQHGVLITLKANDTVNNRSRELAGSIRFSLVDVNSQTDSRAQPTAVNYSITASTTEDKVGLTATTADNVVLHTDPSDSNVKWGMNAYGLLVKDTKDSTSPRQLVITEPKNQRVPQVYLTSGVTTTTTAGSSGTSTVTEVIKIDVGAAQLASKVAGRETTENLILVGGPCANAAAAVVKGVTAANCADGYVDGEAWVELFEHANGKVAMLVAGYTAADTRAAAQVVANYDANKAKFKGTKLKVSDTSAATPMVSSGTTTA